MRRIWTAVCSFSVFALAACGGTQDSMFSLGGGERSAAPSPGGATSADGKSAPGASGDGDEAATQGPQPGQEQAGVLTAGVWDDNLNFDFFNTYVSLSGALGGVPGWSLEERTAAHDRWGQRAGGGLSELDVAFVIDTTGSMGDELAYVQAEIDDIASSVLASHPQMAARFGLVVYRDHSDAYVSRTFGFEGLDEFRRDLRAQNVAGGGDLPEAVPEGLEAMNALPWRPGAVARLAFWIADAPHHAGDEQRVRAAVDGAASKDVHVYPVAASGTDDRAEFTMRAAAQITGGRYLFLTDDSGVGNDHAEPHIPCYHVTAFNRAVVRMIESELTGTRVEPAATEILRTVGNPTNGQCATASQGNVAIY